MKKSICPVVFRSLGSLPKHPLRTRASFSARLPDSFPYRPRLCSHQPSFTVEKHVLRYAPKAILLGKPFGRTIRGCQRGPGDAYFLLRSLYFLAVLIRIEADRDNLEATIPV